MVTRILQPRETSGKVLDYNEEKVLRGDASLVMSRNMQGTSIAEVYDTFQRYESNPSISERTRSTSFHMAVNPSDDDRVDEQAVLDYIAEVMERLGYGDQPYVVYRHNDIDREHYHVASVRVREDGSHIDNHYEGRRIQAIQNELAPKYGFTVGRRISTAETEKMMPDVQRFVNDGVNVMQNLSALFMKGLQYEFHSLYQFNCIMQAMGVKATMRTRKDGGKNIILRGLDENGKECTRYYSMERHMGIQGSVLYSGRLEQNNSLGVLKATRKEQLLEICDYCLEHSGSEAEFKSILKEVGVAATVLRDEKTGDIRRVTLVDPHNQAIVDSVFSSEVYTLGFVQREKDGRWEKPSPVRKEERRGRGRKAPVGTDATLPAVRRPFFNRERKAELLKRITERVERFSGKKTANAAGRSATVQKRK